MAASRNRLPAHSPAPDASDLDGQVEAVMRAAQVLVAVVARSVAEVEDVVTLPQLRVLVMVATQGSMNLTAVAEGLGVHPSNATRTCDRLVMAGLLDRRDSPGDRRQLELTLTREGERLIASVLQHRREAIAEAVGRMPEAQRQQLATALAAFADASDDITEPALTVLGWTP
jgi:DNA-binding MarR family transcriptional regulator